MCHVYIVPLEIIVAVYSKLCTKLNYPIFPNLKNYISYLCVKAKFALEQATKAQRGKEV